MSVEGQKFSYPGAVATPSQVLSLAEEYRQAAHALLPTGRRRQPLSRAPYRLVAIHSLELHLNALLLATGHPTAKVRGLQHDFATRTELATAAPITVPFDPRGDDRKGRNSEVSRSPGA
jgi:hypothetical protein